MITPQYDTERYISTRKDKTEVMGEEIYEKMNEIV